MIWGTPIPATTRVVQDAPGPIPTLTASAPAATRSRAPSAVATFPPITSRPGNSCLMRLTASSTFREWPWALSRVTTSTLASWSPATRSMRSPETPIAAPTRSRP